MFDKKNIKTFISTYNLFVSGHDLHVGLFDLEYFDNDEDEVNTRQKAIGAQNA